MDGGVRGDMLGLEGEGGAALKLLTFYLDAYRVLNFQRVTI
jgi:hypothetical protein